MNPPLPESLLQESLLPESPFADRFKTNYCPSDAEASEIRALLEAPPPEIPALDDEIARVTQELEILKAKRTAYTDYVSSHQALLSPIRRMPLEILHAIFRHCLPTEHNAVMNTVAAPLLLTHVCRQWRDLAIGMPLLWSSLHIPIPHYPSVSSCLAGSGFTRISTDKKNLTEEQRAVVKSVHLAWKAKIRERKATIEEWLKRAAGSSLSISFVQWDSRRDPGPSSFRSSSKDSSERETVKEIVALVLSYSKQWKALEVAAAKSIVTQFLSVPAKDTPNIQYIRVSSRAKYVSPNHALFNHHGGHHGAPPAATPAEDVEEVSAVPTVMSAPSLRTLSLRVVQDDITKLSAPWANLTSLYFYGYAEPRLTSAAQTTPTFTPNQALDLLAKCPNLRRCGLAVGGSNSHWPPGPGIPAIVEEPQEPRRVVLRHLERFFIQEQTLYPLTRFFESLELPQLSSLSFATTIMPTKRVVRSDDDTVQAAPVAAAAAAAATAAAPVPVVVGNNVPQGLLQQLVALGGAAHIPHMFGPNANVVGLHGGNGNPAERGPSSLVTLLRSYGHNIKRLDFDYHYQTIDDLRECLQLAENVEKLSLNVDVFPNMRASAMMGQMYDRNSVAPAHFSNAFLKEFIPDLQKGGDCLCPKMTHLSVRLATAEFGEETLLEFVRARRSKEAMELSVAPLKKIKVIFALERRKVPGQSDMDEIIETIDEPADLESAMTKLKACRNEWEALAALKEKGDPGLDLEGFTAEVTWPMGDKGLVMMNGKRYFEGVWSPAWGLVDEGELIDWQRTRRWG
ncbi:hypothetical protein D9611_009683 [Ephemerocybe angulata]|uniref:F-box domain-containing protein n=1 Tax=Ephemerocybe angulata TaxID=980116 RepID=A0A8H5FGK0_9AGAR|nr:hypothetical protein D9611_009683 [Tulosesus angulatus]